MSTANVTTTHQDGKLGASSLRWDRTSSKVGACEGSAAFPINTPKLIRNRVQAKNLMVKGPMLDRVKQYFEEVNADLNQEAAPLVCVRSESDTAAASPIPEAGANNAGEAAAPTISGTPTADRDVVLRFQQRRSTRHRCI